VLLLLLLPEVDEDEAPACPGPVEVLRPEEVAEGGPAIYSFPPIGVQLLLLLGVECSVENEVRGNSRFAL